MRVKIKAGVPPCGRRLNRAMMAFAAIAVLFSASITSAQTTLYINPSQSFLSAQVGIFVQVNPDGSGGGFTGLSAPHYSSAMFGNSDTTSYSGTIQVGSTPGVLQLLSGSSIVPNVSATPGPAALGSVPGLFAPRDPVLGPGPPNGTPNSQYGLRTQNFDDLRAALWDMVFDVVPGQPAAFPLGGDNYDLVGQQIALISGRQAYISSNFFPAPDSDDISGLPAVFGTAMPDLNDPTNPDPYGVILAPGTNIASWDGTTLVLPMFSVVKYPLGSVTGLGDLAGIAIFSGQLVAVIPEPSTMVLFGCGLIGMVTCAYRARKRKASAN